MPVKNGNGNGKNGLSKEQRKEVKQLQNKELEPKDHVFIQSPFQEVSQYGWVTSGSAVIDLTRVPLGTNVYERIGISIQPYYFQLRAQVGYADTTNLLRLMLVQYYDDSVVLPSLADTYQSIGVNCVISPFERDMGKKLRVIRDRVITLNNTGEKRQQYVDWSFKLRVRDINFTDGLVTGFNHLMLMAVSDSTASTHPTITFMSRVSYKDS